MKNADKPAVPIEINGFGQYAPEAHTGLTKREMFAMHAMNGYLSNDVMQKSGISFKAVAEKAALMADALLAELEK